MTYCDSLYLQINEISLINYNLDGFVGILYEKLFTMLHQLKKQKIKWMMSNSDTKLVLDSFSDCKKYNIQKYCVEEL
jgi:hypothetical protein